MNLNNTQTLKKIGLTVGIAAIAAFSACSAMAVTNVSVSINQPGVYGRVDIGEPVPQRAWVNPRPVIIQPGPAVYERQPIYLYVPPAQSSNWARYCGRYSACGQPVIFVQDGWVRDRDTQARYGRHDNRHDNRGHHNGRRGDRDGDGVRNGRDHDRDGDGVRNSRDDRPNNPNRR
jgi:hypothetical protein